MTPEALADALSYDDPRRQQEELDAYFQEKYGSGWTLHDISREDLDAWWKIEERIQ